MYLLTSQFISVGVILLILYDLLKNLSALAFCANEIYSSSIFQLRILRFPKSRETFSGTKTSTFAYVLILIYLFSLQDLMSIQYYIERISS